MNVRVIFVFVYLLVKTLARPEGGLRSASGSNVIDWNVIREMKRFKLEVLKTKILKEIKLQEPPNVQTQVQVPKNMLRLLNKNIDDDSSSEEDEELIVYPTNDDYECTNETLCSRFEFDLNVENRTASSVNIWFHKMKPDKPLLVAIGFCTLVQEEDDTCETQEVLREHKMEQGWSAFTVPETLVLLSQQETGVFLVEAYGSNFEMHEGNKPFLVADINSATAERKRRSTRTVPGKICSKECCKIDFYISFKEIGWHFVVAPAGFHANMCYGKCSNDQLNAFPSHYHRTMNLALANKTTIVEKQEHVWTPCCSPTNLKPLNMIYKAANDTTTNSTHTLVHHEIPDMIAESCGCW